MQYLILYSCTSKKKKREFNYALLVKLFMTFTFLPKFLLSKEDFQFAIILGLKIGIGVNFILIV